MGVGEGLGEPGIAGELGSDLQHVLTAGVVLQNERRLPAIVGLHAQAVGIRQVNRCVADDRASSQSAAAVGHSRSGQRHGSAHVR